MKEALKGFPVVSAQISRASNADARNTVQPDQLLDSLCMEAGLRISCGECSKARTDDSQLAVPGETNQSLLRVCGAVLCLSLS